MLFNSIAFFIFLPLVFSLYWLLSESVKWQNLLILFASYFFYGWWSWKFLLLLVITTLLDYLYGFGVSSSNKKKSVFFLWLSIINNLGILCYFKYYDFFASQFQYAFESIGIRISPSFLNIALPIGISFYTFHGMSYIFDIYRGLRKPVKNFVEYAMFVSFFPLLVAGPIERANHLLPQIQKKRVFQYAKAVEGCRLILWGLFKKVVIADSLSPIVDNIFSNYNEFNAYNLIIGAVAFSFQIYSDFSGYSDIAIGTAKVFGFEIISNFKFPYFSRNIAEFWRRWHISLSSWFRDYLYIPLGGSRMGRWVTIRNVFIIFLISGLWHGANWNFIMWGFIHACCFVPLLLVNRNRKYVMTIVAENKKLPSARELMQIAGTFIVVTTSWVFFRADTNIIAIGYLKKIGLDLVRHPDQFLSIPKSLFCFVYIIPLVLLDWRFRRNERILDVPQNKILKNAAYLLMFILVYFFLGENRNPFIYFQF